MTDNDPVDTSNVSGAGEMGGQQFRGSATAQDLRSINKILDVIKSYNHHKMIDPGCGYGGLTRYVANYLKISDIHGIDIDGSRLAQAKLKGIKTHNLDLNKTQLPFTDESFHLVTSFGALEHLIYFDNFFSESFRVLGKGGHIIVAMPNLGSYINRVALLFGFQPRDIEISHKILPGTLPFYTKGFFGHIHSATLHAIKQMMEHYGFTIIKVRCSSPYQTNKLIKVMDKIFSFWPSLSRRFIIIGKKS